MLWLCVVSHTLCDCTDAVPPASQNTDKRSALRLVRETELLGGVLSTTLGRENLYLTAEFVKGDECVLLSGRFPGFAGGEMAKKD